MNYNYLYLFYQNLTVLKRGGKIAVVTKKITPKRR